MHYDQAEQVLREGLSFAKEDDKHLFNMHSLLGDVYETKGDYGRAVSGVRSGERKRATATSAPITRKPTSISGLATPSSTRRRRTRPCSSCNRSGSDLQGCSCGECRPVPDVAGSGSAARRLASVGVGASANLAVFGRPRRSRGSSCARDAWPRRIGGESERCRRYSRWRHGRQPAHFELALYCTFRARSAPTNRRARRAPDGCP